MDKPRAKLSWIAGAIAACAAAVALVLNASPDSGTAVDASTGKPISGVFVVAVWDASVFKGVESSHTCLKVDVTRTDERGRYSLPWWSWNFFPLFFDRRRTYPWFYARGYEGRNGEPEDRDIYALVPETRPAVERMQSLVEQAYQTKCGSHYDPRSSALPYLRAMYDEAKKTLTNNTAPENAILSNLLFQIETLDIGLNQAADKLEKTYDNRGIK